jgi:hypothetical protein
MTRRRIVKSTTYAVGIVVVVIVVVVIIIIIIDIFNIIWGLLC